MDITINVNIENLDELIEAIRLISQPVSVELGYQFDGGEPEEEDKTSDEYLLEHPVKDQVIREGASVFYVTGVDGDDLRYRMVYGDGMLSEPCHYQTSAWKRNNTELLYDPRVHKSLSHAGLQEEVKEHQYDKIYNLRWFPSGVEELS